jgi:hypothetical protein
MWMEGVPSSHDSKKFRTISIEKRREMAFGFRKTATAVIKPGEIENIDISFYSLRKIF